MVVLRHKKMNKKDTQARFLPDLKKKGSSVPPSSKCTFGWSRENWKYYTASDTQRRELLLVSLAEGTPELLGGPRTVFRGVFFTPKLPLNRILT